jgi:hypothetical protein
MRLELETFHIYTSTLMDRVARIYPTYFGEKNAVVANTDESFWKQAKHRRDIRRSPTRIGHHVSHRWDRSHAVNRQERVIASKSGVARRAASAATIARLRLIAKFQCLATAPPANRRLLV